MAQDTGLPDIQLDGAGLYREDMFTDRKAGTIRRLVPVTVDGHTDPSRSVLYSGQTQLLTPTGVLPLGFEIEADSLEDVTDPVGRTFRAFADQTRSDRRALAACLRGSRRLMTSEEAAGIAVPVLIAVGTSDEIAGSAAALGEIIPGAEVLDIPNRDHMRAVGDKVYKTGVLEFLSRHP